MWVALKAQRSGGRWVQKGEAMPEASSWRDPHLWASRGFIEWRNDLPPLEVSAVGSAPPDVGPARSVSEPKSDAGTETGAVAAPVLVPAQPKPPRKNKRTVTRKSKPVKADA